MESILVRINELQPQLRLLEIGKVIDNPRQKWTSREKAIHILQSVSNFYDQRGFNESKQSEAVIKCLKDLLGFTDTDIAKLALENNLYIKEVESWLNNNRADWIN